jgi:hypothetical protein
LRPRLAALQTLVYPDRLALATHDRDIDDRTWNAVGTGIWTNSGNVARRFGVEAEESSALLGVFQEEQELGPPSGSVLALGRK